MQLLMVPLSPAYQKLPKTIETTHLKCPFIFCQKNYFTWSLLICPKCQNTQVYVKCMSVDYFFETAKKQFFCILMQLLMVPLSRAYQKLPKTIEITHLK